MLIAYLVVPLCSTALFHPIVLEHVKCLRLDSDNPTESTTPRKPKHEHFCTTQALIKTGYSLNCPGYFDESKVSQLLMEISEKH